MPRLSVLVPVYNEARTIREVLEGVASVCLPVEREIIVVNDGSTDATESEILQFREATPDTLVHYLRHPTNRGKGASLQTALSKASGDFVVIQDADLEYDPRDFSSLLAPLLADQADVVYGSRFSQKLSHQGPYPGHRLLNRALTFFSNLFTRWQLTDVTSGSKMFRTRLLKAVALKEQRFGFEVEVTARLAKLPEVRWREIPISYRARSYKEGKKLRWPDGFRIFFCILRYGLTD